jgi:(1->4)-alpha-D-glucan 1-alpha-D-glucosylmutase
VDPDNRRPVDYAVRRELLDRIQTQLARGTSRRLLANQLFRNPADGAIKLYTLAMALAHRQAMPDLYAYGSHHPVEVAGRHANCAIAFARGYEGSTVVVVAPRLVAPLLAAGSSTNLLGAKTWGDTRIHLGEKERGRRLRNHLTDESFVAAETGELLLGELFETVPLALLGAE